MHSGTALQALPNQGVNTGLNTNGPVAKYQIRFNTAGTYYVYVRGFAPNPNDGSNNSVHAGLNGNAATNQSGLGLGGFRASGFQWQSHSNGEQDTAISVPAAGVYTFSLWMREDGVVADRIWLSTNRTAVGNGTTGFGPAESDCQGGGGAPTATPTAP